MATFRPLILAVVALALPGPGRADPFAMLRAAYQARDASAAALAYTPDAEVVYAYANTAEERYRGQASIAKSFTSLFSQFEPSAKADLNFRATVRQGPRIAGYYRLRVGKDFTTYGTFAVTISRDGRFEADRSSDATRDDFEDAAGKVMFASEDEDLDAGYYDRLTGRYSLPNGCNVVVTRSTVRLFARDSCNQQWRGLSRISGREWTAGDRAVSDQANTSYRFDAVSRGTSPALTIRRGPQATRAVRRDPYRREAVNFASRDGTKLAGTLYIPAGAARRRAAVVLIHGSGAQDRNGYASIIAVMADAMAASGRIVLTYDKRGVGSSAGDWTRAGFDLLADDAGAAMRFLMERREVDPRRVGLAGSSQAGWVVAKAIERGSRPADVFLLGAAGAAMTVAEQNLYNTEVRMRCAGLPAADVAAALGQQRAFFAFLADPARAADLDRLTSAARARPALRDWLFPSSAETDRRSGNWYTTLDPAFDPLPVWRRFKGPMQFVFAEFDDSTPTVVAAARLRGTGAVVTVLGGGQHLGLLAGDRCKAGLSDVSAFSPQLIDRLSRFAAAAPDRRQR